MSSVASRSFQITAAIVVLVSLFVAMLWFSRTELGSTVFGEKEIAAGVYTYTVPYAQDVEVEVTYIDKEHWLHVVPKNDEVGQQWTARVGSTLYDADHHSGEILIIREVARDHVPEGFLLDPLFLDRVQSDGLEGSPFEGKVRATGEASVSRDQLTVPRVLEVGDERFEVLDYQEEIQVEPEEEVDRLLADPAYEPVDESDLPKPSIQPAPGAD